MSGAEKAPPATLVIFGALGDLTKRLLVPALANLQHEGLLDDETTVLGISYHDSDDAQLVEAIGEFVADNAGWESLRSKVHYLKGDFTDPGAFRTIAQKVGGNVVFYLATAPDFFGPIVDQLGDAGLLEQKDGFRRVVIEKPFGTDLASAQALNRQILARGGEDQFYRIDHFLGKETVQNIMVARFGNALLEAVWNNRYVDHVQITAAETVTVGTRGKFYDATGALRDMVPNHLFQLLAMVGMEPPNSADAEAIRTEKAKVIAAVRPIDPQDAARGRYQAGTIADKPVPDYLEEPDVDPSSTTETYVALKLAVETWRWTGVPFYLRTGKGLTTRDTEIVIQFREVPMSLLPSDDTRSPNQLVLQIQPKEGIRIGFVAKKPGPVMETAPVSLDFCYADAFELGHRTGYETLLYDVLIGDQTLFQRADQIEGGWRAVQQVLDAWAKDHPEGYTAGSAGPASAAELLARDGRQWHPLT